MIRISRVSRGAIALALVMISRPRSRVSAGLADCLSDPFFPLAGNGGYDVGNYALDFDYNPQTRGRRHEPSERHGDAGPIQLRPRLPDTTSIA